MTLNANKQNILLISDASVRACRVEECNDDLVNLLTESRLLCDISSSNTLGKSKKLFTVRRKVKEMLEKAETSLPEGVSFLVKECYRPLKIQEESFKQYFLELKTKNPDWENSRVYDECSKFIAPPDIAPHSTGGAVDLTLIDETGNPLDMGTEYDADPYITGNATYTSTASIGEIPSLNRKILISAMNGVGFVNYPTEWWHWSFGDKYWAVVTGHPHALFESKDIEEA